MLISAVKMERFKFVIILLAMEGIISLPGLTIDNQLVIIANDCYTRIAIGSRLSSKDISSSTTVETVSDCEDECSRRRNDCDVFSFGISSQGNSTCQVGSRVPNPEGLQVDPDYDVYVRRQESPDCEPDRIYQLGSGGKRHPSDDRKSGSDITHPKPQSFRPIRPVHDDGPRRPNNDARPSVNKRPNSKGPRPPSDDRRPPDVNEDIPRPGGFGTFSIGRPSDDRRPVTPRPTSQSGNDRIPVDDKNGSVDNLSRPVSTGPGLTGVDFVRPENPNLSGTFLDKFDDERPGGAGYHKGTFFGGHSLGIAHSQSYNEIHRYNRPKPSGNGAGPFDKDNPNIPAGFIPENSYGFHGYRPNSHKGPENERFEGTYTGGTQNQDFGFEDFGNKYHYVVEGNDGFGIDIYERPESCYRRLLAGKRVLEIHIRRAVECDRIEDCHKECDSEKIFPCEGFNYRQMGTGPRGLCELTSMPSTRMDVHRDFLPDSHYDYYERDSNCFTQQFRPNHRPSSWPNDLPRPGYRPQPGDQRPYPPDRRPLDPPLPDRRPYIPDRRPTYDDRRPSDIPRPFDHDRKPLDDFPRPLGPVNRPPDDLYFHRRPVDDDRRPQVPNRELDPRPIGPYGPGRPIRIHPIEDDFYTGHSRPGRPYLPKFPDRRPDNGYRPYHDIGTNEIGPYLSDRRKDWSNGWGSYGGTYGGSYGYGTNYIDKFDAATENHRPKPPPRPHDGNNFYGDFHNYGGAFGYGDSQVPAHGTGGYGGFGKEQECSIRSGAGFKLRRGIVRRSYLTPNLDQCESLCAREKEFICLTFSYRYSLAASNPTDNCLLSELSYRDLDFYIDLDPDRDYDIYAMTGNSRSCEGERPPSQHPREECFWRVRSGFGMPSDVIKKSCLVESLGACEEECVDSRSFTCRSFIYRYGPLVIDGPSNCFLSDWPSREIDPVSLIELEGAELYERGSFGRGCEPYPFPLLNPNRERPTIGHKQERGDEVCYAGYRSPCRLTAYAVLSTEIVDSESECRQKCSRMREKNPIPCMSFSYRMKNDRRGKNCFLSDVPRRDLRLGLDYVPDEEHILFAWRELEPQCDSGYPQVHEYFIGQGPETSNRPQYGSGRPSPGYGHERPGYESKPRPPDYGPRPGRPDIGGHNRPGFDDHHRPGGGYGHGSRPDVGDGYHGVRPLDPDRPDPSGPGYGGDRPAGPGRPGGGGNRPFSGFDDIFEYGFDGNGGDRFDFSYPDELSTFEHFTVNGYPCKRGTRCERNKVAGFWSCEPEGWEYGTWDYCCEPNHHCGFSHGYHYPWCYVGQFEDQWRPCSEQYYPYLPSPRPIRPSTDHYDQQDQHDHYDDIPKPLLGRHWPVAYLHRESPPNATDSMASADNRRNRKINEKRIERSKSSSRFAEASQNVRGLSSNETSRNLRSKYPGVESRPFRTIGRTENLMNYRRDKFADALPLSTRNFTVSRVAGSSRENSKSSKIISAGNFSERTVGSADSSEASWSDKKFVEVPLTSRNDTDDFKIEDYFEVVTVE